MAQYRLGDLVRIDIIDELDADHCWHGEHGIVIDVVHTRGIAYEVGLERYPIVMDVTQRDIRPPFREFSRVE